MIKPTLDIETAWLRTAPGEIAGVDEAGRGPLAGPVVAAAVILDPGQALEGINDSKKLSARAREALFEPLISGARAVAIGIASVGEIESLNIRGASLLAMRRAIVGLAVRPAMALIDGNAIPAQLPCDARAIIRGDSASLSIAAASIIAKVTRDRLMERLHERYPQYCFAANAGYGTAAHLAALAAHGPRNCHRRGFAPVRAALTRP